MQEIQERPYGAKVKTLCRALLWSTYLAVFVNLRGPSCPSCFSQNFSHLPIASPVARLPRVPFSVLRSPFSGVASAAPWSFVFFVIAPQGKPSTLL